MPRKAKEKIDENEIIDKKKESKNKKSIIAKEPEKKAVLKKTRTKKTDSKEDKTTTKKSSSKKNTEVDEIKPSAKKSSSKKIASEVDETKSSTKKSSSKKVASEVDGTKSSTKKSSSKKVASEVDETKPSTKKSSSKKVASEVDETKPSVKKSSSKKIVSEVNETKPSTKKVVSEVDETTSSTKKSSSKKIAAEKGTTKSSTKKTATKKTTKSSSTKNVKKEIEEPPINIIEYYDLPYKYGNTLVKLLAQTPKTLFVYWEVSDEDINNFKKLYGDDFFLRTKPVLIIHNLTLNKTYETEINDFANCWYLNTEDSDCKFDIEIGRRLINPSNDFNTTNNITIPNYLHIATSNDMQSPNDHILFEKIKEFVIFRDVSNNNTIKKNIKSFKFLKDIYKFYKEMYDEDILTNNPSSNSSNFNF